MTLEEFQTVTVVRDLTHDWFNNTGCQYPLVCPKGTKVKSLGVYKNYYGTWAEVEYQGNLQYCFLKDLDKYILEKKEISYFDAPSCRNVNIIIYRMNTGEEYRL